MLPVHFPAVRSLDSWVHNLPVQLTSFIGRERAIADIKGDFRFIRAFSVLNDGSEIDRRYQENAERILVQSVAASTMLAHLAAAALGYSVWWVSAIGQEEIQKEFKPLLRVPEALSLVDIMCFGPPLQAPYKRWKKRLDQIIGDHS